MRRRRPILATLALLTLLLAGCATVVEAPEPQLDEPVTIDLCNTTVCVPWHNRQHRPHHHERGD